MSRQCDQVLDYLRRHGSITHHEAEAAYGITRLGARIWDLKRPPYNQAITETLTAGPNRFGRTCHYSTYTLDAPTPERELVAAPTQRELGPTPGVEAQLELLQVRAQGGPREA